MPTDRKLHALSGASALAREQGAQVPSFVTQILADVEATKARGREAVSVNGNLMKLKEVKRKINEAIKPIVAKIDETRASEDLTDNGRARVLIELEQQLHESLYKVVEEYNETEKQLLDSFPKPETPKLKLTEAEGARLLLLLGQIPQLSPHEFMVEFKSFVAGMDRHAVQALLPIAQTKLREPEFQAIEQHQDISSPDRLERLIGLGEKLLHTGSDGWRNEAHTYAREVAQSIRAQMETVAETVIEEGRWEGTLPARMRRGDGRFGTVPDLQPLDGEAEVEVPFGGAH